MYSSVNCSSCGGKGDLYFVTCGQAGSDSPGRTLVYCAACRKERHQMIDVSIPLSLLTPDLFLDLYRLGKTTSSPDTAVELVFGKPVDEISRAAEAILSTRRP